jgi:hypothetical protein
MSNEPRGKILRYGYFSMNSTVSIASYSSPLTSGNESLNRSPKKHSRLESDITAVKTKCIRFTFACTWLHSNAINIKIIAIWYEDIGFSWVISFSLSKFSFYIQKPSPWTNTYIYICTYICANFHDDLSHGVQSILSSDRQTNIHLYNVCIITEMSHRTSFETFIRLWIDSKRFFLWKSLFIPSTELLGWIPPKILRKSEYDWISFPEISNTI